MKNIRTCIGCRTKKDKYEYIRIVSKNSHPILDKNMNYNSRGIYICKCKECIAKCIGALEKGRLNVKIDINKDELKNILKNVEIELGE